MEMIYVPIYFICVTILLGKGLGRDVEERSSVDCVGAWTNCSTNSLGVLTCHLHFAQRPFQSTICHVRMACVVEGVIELYDDSPHTLAFDNKELPISPFAQIVEYNSKWNIRFKVRKPLAEQGTYGVKFDSIAGVLIEKVANRNIRHVYGDGVWPVFQMLHRHSFDFHNDQFR